MSTSQEQVDKLYAINLEMRRLEEAGLWTREAFTRLCSEARAAAPDCFDVCNTLRRHADHSWLRGSAA